MLLEGVLEGVSDAEDPRDTEAVRDSVMVGVTEGVTVRVGGLEGVPEGDAVRDRLGVVEPVGDSVGVTLVVAVSEAERTGVWELEEDLEGVADTERLGLAEGEGKGSNTTGNSEAMPAAAEVASG